MELKDMLNTVICGDCLDVMREIEDKSVDLVLTDPPYGIGNRLSDGGGKLKNTPMAVLYRETEWIDEVPTQEYFDEIFRISKNQIICGGNYFNLPPTRGFVMWDKKQYIHTLSACEYIWTSFDCPAKIASFSSMDLNRVHPTQKPLKLIKWLLMKFSQENSLILDPFLGSGTTAIACIDTTRQWIGIEREQAYCSIANKRISQHLQQQVMDL